MRVVLTSDRPAARGLFTLLVDCYLAHSDGWGWARAGLAMCLPCLGELRGKWDDVAGVVDIKHDTASRLWRRELTRFDC